MADFACGGRCAVQLTSDKLRSQRRFFASISRKFVILSEAKNLH